MTQGPPTIADDPQAPGEPAPELYTTGDLARLTGNTLRAVRHYDSLGLILPVGRGSRGERLFDASQLERLQFISDMRALSFSLRSIQELLEARDGAGGPAEVASRTIPLLEARIEELRDKLRTLNRLRAELSRARETAEECRDCRHDWDQQVCSECELDRPGPSPPLLRLLWQRRES